ncbi:MAG: DUF4445 domain-containing protein [Ruminococcaceae bacterium]|nr:DUF4445 domain-containing protein [Oscillospiraceae bacterium]
MPRLKIITEETQKEITFSGAPVLKDLLKQEGYFIDSPCGGNGKCGKCTVKLFDGISHSNNLQWEIKLACKTILTADTTVKLPEIFIENAFVETDIGTIQSKNCKFQYGAALDIGTTTIALKLFSKEGKAVAEAVSVNPQRSVSSDVMGRISAAVDGKLPLLNLQITDCINNLFENICNTAGIERKDIEKTVITGNTAMLYLLCGINPKSIAVAPFKADNLFGVEINSPVKAYLPPCINAFVGADLVCSVIASGMCESNKTALLCDIGTNGEIALWKNGRLYVTSAAAGPAFEGAEISCGCPCVDGAIDKVWFENQRIFTHTINNSPAVGICGSGLIDAVAAFLEQGYIDSDGISPSVLNLPSHGKPISITAEDIRALQLAKSAVCSAIETVLAATSVEFDEIEAFYLVGGFGNRLNLDSAVEIGLIPKALARKTKQMGNGALKGAAMILFDEGLKQKAIETALKAEHIQLGGNELFNQRFCENLRF